MIHRHSGLVFAEHTLSVPLNHGDPEGPRIEIFAREVRETDPAADPAAIYFDDMYVDREMSLATAGLIKNVRPWVTNEYAHDGLGRDEHVLDRLLTMVTD